MSAAQKGLSVIEDLSPELIKDLEKAQPGPGQKAIFELIKARTLKGKRHVPRRVRIRPDAVIYDPYAKRRVSISYKKGFRNADLQKGIPETPIYGDILFIRENDGLITISGDSPQDLDLFYYLYLCPYNRDNAKKQWHVPADGSAKFIMRKVKAGAIERNEGRAQRREAGNLVDDMTRKELLATARGFNIPGISNSTSDDEIRDVLHTKIVEKTPERVLSLAGDKTFKMVSLINEALERGDIELNDNFWKWNKGANILRVENTKNSKEEFAEYLISVDGMDTKKALEKASKKKVTKEPEKAEV